MIKKVIKKGDISGHSDKENLAYWLSKSPEERIEAVEILRRQYYRSSTRIQRVVKVIQLSKD